MFTHRLLLVLSLHYLHYHSVNAVLPITSLPYTLLSSTLLSVSLLLVSLLLSTSSSILTAVSSLPSFAIDYLSVSTL
jgi:hypothetical protein